MYGMVNKAVQDLIVNQFGTEAWDDVRRQAGVDQDFVLMHQYPDEVTGRLVAAASTRLQMPPEAVLEAFGLYWIKYTAHAGYGDVLRLAGGSFISFLQNLDTMHARVGLTFPQLMPPSFQCTDITPHSVVLHYHSTRGGLAPLVVGLVKGLGQMFRTRVQITQTAARGDNSDHDIFFIEYDIA